MINKILSMMKKEYRLKSLDAGVFHKLVVRGMDFEINSYEAQGVGRVATVCASGLFGLIKRDVLIVSPLNKEAAVVSYERVVSFGKDTVILSRYDLVNDVQYVKEVGRKKQKEQLDAKVENYFTEYLSEIRDADKADVKAHKQRVDELVEAIVTSGNLIADIFVATYGGRITRKLYHQVLFGTRE